MSRLIDVAAVLESMAKALDGTEQGAACEFAVRLMRQTTYSDGANCRKRPAGELRRFRAGLCQKCGELMEHGHDCDDITTSVPSASAAPEASPSPSSSPERSSP